VVGALLLGAATGHVRQPAAAGEVRHGGFGALRSPGGPATGAVHLSTPLQPPISRAARGASSPRAADSPLTADPGARRAPPALSAPSPGSPVPAVPTRNPLPEAREFFFTRGAYTSYGRGYWRGGESWAIDYPEADHHFLTVLKRLTNLDAYDSDNAVRLDDPDLRRFPFLYILEVGRMDLSPGEIQGLRNYLNAGGFLVVDDFWGEREWANFEYQMARVIPGRQIVPLHLDHPLFSTFYDIDEVRQTPAYGRGINGRPTSECAGCVATVLGIYDDDDRLMVVINWNTDLGDAWEHADDPYYPLPYSTYAYQVGVNLVVYGMSH
jgi:hypothetical protein